MKTIRKAGSEIRRGNGWDNMNIDNDAFAFTNFLALTAFCVGLIARRRQQAPLMLLSAESFEAAFVRRRRADDKL